MKSEASDLLLKIYDITKSWLEYAEKKNLVLFTIIGFELAIIKFMAVSMSYKYIEISLVFLVFAFIVALMSFYPKTNRLPFLRKSKKTVGGNKLNLLFYGDIQKIDSGSYVQLFEKEYDLKIEDKKLAKDLVDQIVILSEIAMSKFQLFKIAVSFAIMGQFSLFLTILINVLFLR